ncbi:hypothetical protein Afil01_00690 [Actinorhabdospora filicis]|uniref:Uncharacterized protein n=1 Tax=Actinorhabdospora filicis TaxID=1785913 RepID=A0A9W6W0X6_9ACTN|nr:DUF6069 family protein [Actinorhabdospora filicis]GLZ75262.1 hypothetical protein Afil01_00690 [Actinorhabdospora filicis]
MTTYRHQPDDPYRADAPAQSRVNGGRLWSGGVAAALVAAGIAMVGFLVVKGLLKLPILGVDVDGAVTQPGLFTYGIIAFLCALLATGVMHLLLLATPKPFMFFGWIIALATILGMLVPLLAVADIQTGAATAAVNLVIGVSIGILVGISATASLRRPDTAGYQPPDQYNPATGR